MLQRVGVCGYYRSKKFIDVPLVYLLWHIDGLCVGAVLGVSFEWVVIYIATAKTDAILSSLNVVVYALRVCEQWQCQQQYEDCDLFFHLIWGSDDEAENKFRHFQCQRGDACIEEWFSAVNCNV